MNYMNSSDQNKFDENYDDIQIPDTLVLSEQELKDLNIKKLIEINKEKRLLEQRARSILTALSDTEKRERIYEIVQKLHKAVLDDDTELREILEEVLDSDDVEFYLQHKHEKFFRSADVFDKFVKHPVQKSMTKAKCLSKRKIKKQKTPSQHIEYMVLSKEIYSLKRRMEVVESTVVALSEKLEKQQIQINEQKANLIKQSRSLSAQESEQLSKEESLLISRAVHPQKIALYKTSVENNKLTQKELAKMFKITDRSVRNWLKEIQEELSK